MAKQYLLNVIMQSPLTGLYYFAQKVEVLGGGMHRVVSKKIDVTESINRLFGPMLEREKRPLFNKRKRKSGRRAR